MNFVEQDQNGNKIFKVSDFERMFIIASLKRAGMAIKQIREFTALYLRDCRLFLAQRENVEEQVTELQDALDVLRYKSWLYDNALKTGTTDIKPEEMPANIQKVKKSIV